MYLYYDKAGILKEIINDIPLRVGSSNWNKLYVYFEDANLLDNAYVKYTLDSGIITNPIEKNSRIALNSEESYIPYSDKRDLKYFRYGISYSFFVFNVPDNVLGSKGLVVSSFSIFDNAGTLIKALQANTFYVEEGSPVIEPSESISVSEYNYLLKRIEKLISTGVATELQESDSIEITTDKQFKVKNDFINNLITAFITNIDGYDAEKKQN